MCHTYQQDNHGVVITKYSFTPLFAKAWSQSFTPNNLIFGFRKCGIYPFNAEVIEILDDEFALAPDAEQQPASSSQQPVSSLQQPRSSSKQQSVSSSQQHEDVSTSHQ